MDSSALKCLEKIFRVYCEDVFTTKDTKGSDDKISELRALRDLRGELDFLIVRDYRGEQNKMNVTHVPHKNLKNQKNARLISSSQ
jgi:hypothetical protein